MSNVVWFSPQEEIYIQIAYQLQSIGWTAVSLERGTSTVPTNVASQFNFDNTEALINAVAVAEGLSRKEVDDTKQWISQKVLELVQFGTAANHVVLGYPETVPVIFLGLIFDRLKIKYSALMRTGISNYCFLYDSLFDHQIQFPENSFQISHSANLLQAKSEPTSNWVGLSEDANNRVLSVSWIACLLSLQFIKSLQLRQMR